MKRLIFVAALAAVTAHAQQPVAPPPDESTPPAIGHYVGVVACSNSGCHGSTQPLDATRILQNEYFTWLNSDRHAGAYNVLFSDRSARIAHNMRLRKHAYEEATCLDCHTTNLPRATISGTIDVEDGVQCEACHGPAGGWLAGHTEEGWTHEKSVTGGMIDLRSIGTRASVCSACHLGNAKKEVDHELIASGHPLLDFELDNYTESMPVHWKPNATHGVRAWAVGQVVMFRDSLDNLARHSKGEEWPEFSEMSCVNCHHALKTGGWRQERGWPGRAGLPAWSPQRWAMLRLLIGRISPETRDQLDPIVADIARDVARMSNPGAVITGVVRARQLVEPLVSKAGTARWSDADVRAFMTAIADDRAFIAAADVRTAEQAALALQSLASQLSRRDPKLLRGPMMRAIDALFEEVANRDDYDQARFSEKLEAVQGALRD